MRVPTVSVPLSDREETFGLAVSRCARFHQTYKERDRELELPLRERLLNNADG